MGGLAELLLISIGIVIAVGAVVWVMHVASSRDTSGGDDVRNPLRGALKAMLANDDPDAVTLPAWVGHDVDDASGEALRGTRQGRQVSVVMHVDERGRAQLTVWLATNAVGRFRVELDVQADDDVERMIDEHETDDLGRAALVRVPDAWLAGLDAIWPTDELLHRPGALSWQSHELVRWPVGGSFQHVVRGVMQHLDQIATHVEHHAAR